MAHLGIDIGGTKVVLVISDQAGRPLESVRAPMSLSGDAQQDLAELVARARKLLDAARSQGGGPLDRIGISVPGPADPLRGVLLNPPNLPGWRDVSIAQVFEDAFGVETRVENDANAAALAEHTYGAGQGVSDLVYLTMSTGVGGGVISDGRLLRGAFGGAAEPGHMPIAFPGRACACGLSGCLEAYVGGNAWRDRLREEFRGSAPPHAPGGIIARAGGEPGQVLPEHVVAAARAGDPVAERAFAAWLDELSRGLVSLVMLFEPRRIILGTIAVAAGEALCFGPLTARMKQLLWPQQAERLEIVPAGLGAELPQFAGLAVAEHGLPRPRS